MISSLINLENAKKFCSLYKKTRSLYGIINECRNIQYKWNFDVTISTLMIENNLYESEEIKFPIWQFRRDRVGK